MPCLRKKVSKAPLRTPNFMKPKVHGRVPPHVSCKGSMALEASLALPIFLWAATALLYLFAFTSAQARGYRKLLEKAQLMAVTVERDAKSDPYVRLYDYGEARLPFQSLFHGRKAAIRSVSVRAWVGYTGESFQADAGGPFVYITPEGQVYHRSAECSYLSLSVRSVPKSRLKTERNLSGGKYSPCGYCVEDTQARGTVYVTDYGTSYHDSRKCRGLKRTVMAVPVSKVGSRRCCAKCCGS